jgi:hypothetical protein
MVGNSILTAILKTGIGCIDTFVDLLFVFIIIVEYIVGFRAQIQQTF